MTESNQRLAASWKNRIYLTLSAKQMKRIKKGLTTKVVSNYQWYVIQPAEVPEVFDGAGKQLTKAQLRALLKRMA
jgi:hypothetical protein